jgi:predicted amidohydrolase
MRVAAIQMASGPNVAANLSEAEKLIGLAADAGARLVVLPENFALMGNAERDKLDIAEQAGSGPIQRFLARQAASRKIWLVGGTIPLTSQAAGHVRAACLLFNDRGEQVSRYDKIHLFDVAIEQSGEKYNESETIEPGDDIVVSQTPLGRLGLAVCYDLRFPELFRTLLESDMQILAVPSAFTAITGSAHWDILVRARAIENQCYVIAAAQGGYHLSGRETYGHSMIVDPWGNVLDSLPRGSGVVSADIDLGYVERIRRSFPAVQHRRLSCRTTT